MPFLKQDRFSFFSAGMDGKRKDVWGYVNLSKCTKGIQEAWFKSMWMKLKEKNAFQEVVATQKAEK